MRISKIKIKSYRSFNEKGIEIDLPDNNLPLAIVGHNNSGKSNFINAILHCLGIKPSNSYSANDFYFRDVNKKILIELTVDPPLISTDAFMQFKEMPILQLKVNSENGAFNVSHYCCSKDGKPVYNSKTIKRNSKTNYSETQKEILNEVNKDGSETFYKNKSKITAYYIDPTSNHSQFKTNRNTLLGKVLLEIKKDFESKNNIVLQREGIHTNHVGKARTDVFENALTYLEKYIITTPFLETLIKKVESIIISQLDVDCNDFQFAFGFPSVSVFYDNLEFYITDNPEKPKIPVTQMGNGFQSLFIVALFRAFVNTDKGGNIFILEEPETFLHEHFQEYFYNVLVELSKNNQVIYTTHSKKFINLFQPESILKFNCSNYEKTEIIYESSIQINSPTELNGFQITNPDDFGKYMKSLEPNLGNLLFSSKVIIVEGPHDLLGYKISLDQKINFGLKNISIICAWGKDSIVTLIQLCKKYDVSYFVIHDWDIDDPEVDISLDPTCDKSRYNDLCPEQKQQYTKNRKIFLEAGCDFVHANKKQLETVLKIEKKSTASVFQQVNGKKLEKIRKEFPGFIPDKLLSFLENN